MVTVRWGAPLCSTWEYLWHSFSSNNFAISAALAEVGALPSAICSYSMCLLAEAPDTEYANICTNVSITIHHGLVIHRQ